MFDLHPFTVNFYLGDRIVPFECFPADEGYVWMGEQEYDNFMAAFPDYELKEVYNSHHKS